MFVSENCCGLLLTGKLSFPFFLSSCASVIDVSVISKDRDFSAFVLNYSDLFSALQSEACGTLLKCLGSPCSLRTQAPVFLSAFLYAWVPTILWLKLSCLLTSDHD